MSLTPEICIIKPITAVINFVVQIASAFVIASHVVLALRSTLAFCVTELITVVKCFMIQAP